jgi:PiT family inorganic phosphate transporter
MLILFFLSGGLFLGWSLGANDAANIFGTAVGSEMISFKKAAVIASIFIILGAVFQGSGTTQTLSELGSIDTIGGAFAAALCSALVVTLMTKYKLPVSTTQAIVGAIIGWCYFTGTSVNYDVLKKIVGTWVFGPVLGAVFSALLYLLLRKFIRNSRLHLLKMESIIRILLMIVGAFGAYSLGANNIANVMGVFVNSFSFSFSIGSFTISSTQFLFLLGGIAIALGVFTYSKKVMETIGGNILPMTPETAIVVVLSQALVLFIFSSTTLSQAVTSIGLPPIPLVPVSSTQVVVGAVLGIGLVKGIQEIKMKIVGNIALGWVTTPVLTGILTFFSLFFVQSVFGIPVSNQETLPLQTLSTQNQTTNYHIPFEVNTFLVGVLFLLMMIVLYLFFIRYKNKQKLEENERRWTKQVQFSEFQEALSKIEANTIQLENTNLISKLEESKNELITNLLNIGEQREYLELICQGIQEAIEVQDVTEKDRILKEELLRIKQKMSFSNEVDKIYLKAEQAQVNFMERLQAQYPQLSVQERRLLLLLRIGLSSKEIAPLLNISPKSVEISRYRLRKKLNLERDVNLVQFTQTM